MAAGFDGVSEPIKLETVLGWVHAPLAWVIGIPWDHCTLVGSMLGERVVLNELFGYLSLTNSREILDERSFLITSYALLRLCQPGKHRRPDWRAQCPGARAAAGICAHGLLEHGGRTDGLLLDRHHGGPACLRARCCASKSPLALCQDIAKNIAKRQSKRTAKNQESIKIRRRVDPKNQTDG